MRTLGWIMMSLALFILGSIAALVLGYFAITRNERRLKKAMVKTAGCPPKEIGGLDGVAWALCPARRLLMVGTLDAKGNLVARSLNLDRIVRCELVENGCRVMARALRWQGAPRQFISIVEDLDPKTVITSIGIRLDMKDEPGEETLFFFHPPTDARISRGHFSVGPPLEEAVRWHTRLCESLEPANLEEVSATRLESGAVVDKMATGMMEGRGTCMACNQPNRLRRHACFWPGRKVEDTARNTVSLKRNNVTYAVAEPIIGGVCSECIRKERRTMRMGAAVAALIFVAFGSGVSTLVARGQYFSGLHVVIWVAVGVFLVGNMAMALEGNDELADQALLKAFEAKCRKSGTTLFFTRKGYRKEPMMPGHWLILIEPDLNATDRMPASAPALPPVVERPAPEPPIPALPPAQVERSRVPDGFKIVGRDADPNSGLPLTIEHEKTGYQLKLVPAGEFNLGSSAGVGESDERPQRHIYLDAYWIGETEVTCEQFAQFLNEKGNQTEGGVTWCSLMGAVKIEQSGGYFKAKSGLGAHPVVELSWFGARAFARWMGGDLPTEPQWEKAAKGGREVTWPWGNTWDKNNAATGDHTDTTVPVKSYGQNGYGLFDMAGNVLEWCADWYAENAYSQLRDGQRNPTGPSSGDMLTVEYWQGGEKKTEQQAFRVVRGGRVGNRAANARCAHRGLNPPALWFTDFGVRVVVSPRP